MTEDSMEDIDLYENVSDFNDSDAKSGDSGEIKTTKKGNLKNNEKMMDQKTFRLYKNTNTKT